MISMMKTKRQARQDAKNAKEKLPNCPSWRSWRLGVLGVLLFNAMAPAQSMNVNDLNEVLKQHPAAAALLPLFANPNAPVPTDFAPTQLNKKDYLKLIAGNVDFWKKHLNADGAIIDPYENAEKQYSTPAFALAAAELVKEAGRDDLLDSATRAFSFALTALQKKTTANQHADFYIPMLIHAHRILAPRVSKEQAAKWDEQFTSLVPEQVYRDIKGGGNWNLVNVAGEAMRRKDKLVATTQMSAQQGYLDAMLKLQQKHFTKLGMYHDANVPLAYDAFPRMWLEDMLADGAYDGPEKPAIERLLALGSFSSLLLFSPQGEWANGGRSAQHQWNEAECAVIGEINATYWKARGRDDVAGAFKRMARLGLKSMFRWQRPSGEMWIVKNFADPKDRFGFEGYSYHSQYNLLPMAMLAIAYERADDSISEKPVPSEYGSYVFDAREPFHKVCAASGGYYVLIDTMADPHYDSTGLIRVHRRGVELSPLTDSASESYGGKKDDLHLPFTPGIQWKDGDEWIGLANFHRPERPPATTPDEKPAEVKPQRIVKKTDLKSEQDAQGGITLDIVYELEGPGARKVSEHYLIGDGRVFCEQIVEPHAQPLRLAIPVLVNDGLRETEVKFEREASAFTITRSGGLLKFSMRNPPLRFSLQGPKLPTHNGYVQAAVAEIPPGLDDYERWEIHLEPSPLHAK
jgi:hypothetical protein